MNDQSQMMNQSKILNQINQSQAMNQSKMMNPNHSQAMNQSKMMNPNQPQMRNPIPQMMNPPPQMMIQNPSQMMNRGYGIWAQPQPKPSMEPLKFPNYVNTNFTASKPSMPGRNNWKGKKGVDKRKDIRRKEQQKLNQNSGAISGMNVVTGGAGGGGGGYKPPTLQELQSQNRVKARKFYHPKKKFNNRFAPFAPRNTSSYIIRAKKSGGIASLVSPCPVTPAVLPTPIFSPSREVLVDMAKEEWGVDGYGSMKGLIRLRTEGNEAEMHEEEEDEEEGGSSESDVEEHVEVERRLDHDLSRFEMVYPSGVEYNNVLGNRVDDQGTHIAQLEEENLTLKERLFLMERELGDMRRRLQCLERHSQVVDDVNEEVVENGSENDSESSEKGDSHHSHHGHHAQVVGENNIDMVEYVAGIEEADAVVEEPVEYVYEGGDVMNEDTTNGGMKNEEETVAGLNGLSIASEMNVIAKVEERMEKSKEGNAIDTCEERMEKSKEVNAIDKDEETLEKSKEVNAVDKDEDTLEKSKEVNAVDKDEETMEKSIGNGDDLPNRPSL